MATIQRPPLLHPVHVFDDLVELWYTVVVGVLRLEEAMRGKRTRIRRKAVARDVKLINASPVGTKAAPEKASRVRASAKARKHVVRKIKVGKAIW